MFVKDHLQPTTISEGVANAEIMWIKTSLPDTWIIGGCYRPEVDELNILEKISNSIDDVCGQDENKNCILLGDFNFRNINWSTMMEPTIKKFFFT